MATPKKKLPQQPPTQVEPEVASVWFRAGATYVDESGDSFFGHVFVEQKNGATQSVKVHFPQGVPWRTKAWSIEAESGVTGVPETDAASAEEWLKRKKIRPGAAEPYQCDRVICRGIVAMGGRIAPGTAAKPVEWALPGGWPLGEDCLVGGVSGAVAVPSHGLASFQESAQTSSAKGIVTTRELGFDTIPRSAYTGWAQVSEAIRVIMQGTAVKIFGQNVTLSRAIEVWNFAGQEASAFTKTIFMDPRPTAGSTNVPEVGSALHFEPRFLSPTQAGNTVTFTHKVWYKDGTAPATFVGFLRIRRDSTGRISGQDWWVNHAFQTGLTQWVLSPYNRIRIDPVDADITKTFTATLPSGSWYTCSAPRIS